MNIEAPAPERARYVKPGELLAMASTRLHQDRKGFFWMMGSGVLPNERQGDVAIVHVRGELEHHAERWGCAESYEGILEKARAAYSGQDAVDAHERAHRYDDDFAPLEMSPPKRVVFCIDSPGGVVSGLNECVAALERMRKEHPEIKVSAYVNEMATSAAYAIACACDEIVCPPSAIIGSIGVISTMISAAARDKKEGFDVRLITSGARKGDGHLHAPISDGALEAETQRVEKLALAFFRLAGKARGLSVNKIRSFQAGIFLGNDAIRVGLADGIRPFDEFLRAQGETGRGRTEKTRMNLTTLIKKTRAAIATEEDPKRLRELSAALGSYTASLEAYKKTEKHVEHVKTEESADDEDDDEDEPEEKADAKEEKAVAAESEEKEASAKSDDEDDDEDDDKESAKKALALVRSLTGMTGKKALGALQAIAATAEQAAKDVAVLKRDGLTRDKAALIASAKGKHVTPKEATWLATQKMSVVQGFVEMRRKSGVIVHVDESTILQPKASAPGSVDSLPQFTRDMIDSAVAAATGDKAKIRAELEAAHLKAHNERITHALNGAAEGRY